MYDVLVIGSGAAGVAAALELVRCGEKPCVVDVGFTRRNKPLIEQNLYEYRKANNSFLLTIGDDYDGIQNLLTGDTSAMVKLKAPQMKFITMQADELSPILDENFLAIQSFAAGGLGNAWGAGLYRFADEDLDGFPFTQRDLEPFYDELTKEIGISGEDDDLTPFFGSPRYLQQPLNRSHNCRKIYSGYVNNKKYLNSQGVFVGTPRLGVLTQSKDGRNVFEYKNLEFWQSGMSSIYTPLLTLEKLVKEKKIEYLPGHLVTRWDEQGDKINVYAERIKDNSGVILECRKLIVAAGAINSTKLALASNHDYATQLKLQDKPAIQIPLLLLSRIGKRLDTEAFGLTPLNIVWKNDALGQTLLGGFLELTSPLRAEFYPQLPFCSSENLKLMRYLLPAMMVCQLYFPTSAKTAALISLKPNNAVSIQGQMNEIDIKNVRKLIKYFRVMGAWTHPSYFVQLETTMHYASTLPMMDDPFDRYQCDRYGKLFGSSNVYIADAAGFPKLPAKNFGLTLMANAMRVARYVSGTLE